MNSQEDKKLNTTTEDEINLLELLLVLALNWKRIIAVSVVVGVITAIGTFLLPNVYTARALVLPVEENNSGLMNAMVAQMGGLAALAGGVGGTTKADLYVTMMGSETIMDPIIEKFGLMKLYNATFRADAYAKLRDCSDIKVGKNDGVITIAVSDRSPKLAADIANAYVDQLGKLVAKLGMTGAAANRSFLEDRLATAKTDLAEAEDRLTSFQTKNKTVSVSDQAKATLEGAAQLRAQLVSQEVQLAIQRQTLTEQSNEVKSAKATIANLKAQISKLENGSSSGALPGLNAVPQLGEEYLRLMREFKVQETLVELLTKQHELTKLNEAKDLSSFQVLQSAKVPDVKSKPRRSLIVIIVVLVIGGGMVLQVLFRHFGTKLNEQDRIMLRQLQSQFPIPRIRNKRQQ